MPPGQRHSYSFPWRGIANLSVSARLVLASFLKLYSLLTGTRSGNATVKCLDWLLTVFCFLHFLCLHAFYIRLMIYPSRSLLPLSSDLTYSREGLECECDLVSRFLGSGLLRSSLPHFLENFPRWRLHFIFLLLAINLSVYASWIAAAPTLAPVFTRYFGIIAPFFFACQSSMFPRT